MELTTDTVAYCFRLAAQVESFSALTAEIRQLVIDGRRMCSEGHVIGGLVRLRRAFLIVHGATPDQ